MSLASVLDTMTYKPTFSFELVDVNGSQLLRVTMRTHDSRPDEPVPLSVPVDFPVPDVDGVPEGYWERWLHSKISWCEQHESDEWLRFGGELYRDPHEEAMIR